MANVEEIKKDQNVETEDKAQNPPKDDESKNETKKEDNWFVKAAKWTGSKAKAAGKFLWRNKGKVALIFGTGVITGAVLSNMAHSSGSSETTGMDTELLTGTVDTPLIPDVDANVNVDVDVDDNIVNVEDYMNNV